MSLDFTVVPCVIGTTDMKIYTKTGDKGLTSLFSGQRIPKSDIRVRAYGAVDEACAIIGVVYELCDPAWQDIARDLETIQSDMFHLGSVLATHSPDHASIERLIRRTEEMEKNIDRLQSELPELTNFILPSGGLASAYCHVARTIIRRAEREIASLNSTEPVDPAILTYVNRLSDACFVYARVICMRSGRSERIWKREE
jgi:cob(I)alamin adenosyltransferase